MNILRQLADEAEVRVENKRKEVSDEEIRHQALLKSLERRREGRGWNFEKTLAGPGISVIAELKKASPSKGMICEDFDYLGILGQYEQAGASCISCLTEPAHFLGSTEILRDVCSNTKLPVLCKDFTVDEYQITKPVPAVQARYSLSRLCSAKNRSAQCSKRPIRWR